MTDIPPIVADSPSRQPCGGEPASPQERRARREAVRDAMIDGWPAGRICSVLAKQFECGHRTIRVDMRWVERQWRSEEGPRAELRRMRQIQALERIARKAEAMADWAQARGARRDVALLLGMNLTTNGAASRQMRALGSGQAPATPPVLPLEALARFALDDAAHEALVALARRALSPGAVVVEAEVVSPDRSGHHGNGATNGRA